MHEIAVQSIGIIAYDATDVGFLQEIIGILVNHGVSITLMTDITVDTDLYKNRGISIELISLKQKPQFEKLSQTQANIVLLYVDKEEECGSLHEAVYEEMVNVHKLHNV